MGQRATLVFDEPFESLTQRFNVGGRINAAKIPASLYREYISLYHRSADLQRKLEMVMNDGEHQLCMEEGRGRFDLPDENYMQQEVSDLKSTLQSFNPFRTSHCSKGMVSLERGQIQGFFNLFSKDYDIVHGLFEMFRNTDYLPYHRHLRDRGIKYAGPTSLQEIVDVYIGVARTHKRQNAFLATLSSGQAPS